MIQMNSMAQMIDPDLLAVVTARAVDAEDVERALSGTAALGMLALGLVALLTLAWVILAFSRRRQAMGGLERTRREGTADEAAMQDAWQAAGQRMEPEGRDETLGRGRDG